MLIRFSATWGFITALLMLQAWYHVHNIALDQLQQSLPQLTHLAMVNTHNLDEQTAFISEQISQTAVLTPNSDYWPIIKYLNIETVTIDHLNGTADDTYDFTWRDGQTQFAALFNLNWQFSYVSVIAIALLLSVIVHGFMHSKQVLTWLYALSPSKNDTAQPSPIHNNHQTYASLSHGFDMFSLNDVTLFKDIKQDPRLLNLSKRDIHWLCCALFNQHDINSAFTIAQHEDSMVFDPKAQTVTIHGLAIQMSKTPLMYFCWYALRKREGLPAYINPSQQKPDRSHGALLADLMESYDGHQKAIKDLLDNGLKSKTLDQNRNKIKAELSLKLAGLAQDYLIQGERDPRTARYQYSLAIPAQSIHILS